MITRTDQVRVIDKSLKKTYPPAIVADSILLISPPLGEKAINKI